MIRIPTHALPILALTLSLANLAAAQVQSQAPLEQQADRPSDHPPIAVDQLGSLALEFTAARLVSHVPGASVLADVSHRPGAAFRVHAPRRIQQAEYLVEPGEIVSAGQVIVRLSGPEIHHWQTELDSLRARFQLADDRYHRNQPLYEASTIAETTWLDIVSQWHALRLALEDMNHFAELVDMVGEPGDADLLLVAPFASRVNYEVMEAGPDQDQLIAAFAPLDAMRLRARIPSERHSALDALEVNGCRVAVSMVGQQLSGFLLDAWSEPLDGRCGLLPGQTLSVTPLYRGASDGFQVVRVPGSALLAWNHQTYLLRRDGDRLLLEAVSLLTRDGSEFLVRGPERLVDAQVLISSVSAVQGVLMGLGGE
jgi:hypothetical protein